MSIFIVAAAFAQTTYAAQIGRFDASFTVRNDASIQVVEDITYTGDGEWHGIFRDIPMAYETDAGTRSISLSEVAVSDDQGKQIPFEEKRSGNVLHLKIGDPDVVITGTHVFRVAYRAEGALNFFSDYDEFYWNVSGNGWQVPTLKSSASVSLPKAVPFADIKLTCMVGYYGGRARCADASAVVTGGNTTNAAHFTHGELAAREGLTIVVGFPKGLIVKPPALRSAFFAVIDNGIVALPVIVFGFLAWLRWVRGRDPKGRGIIIPEYEPPKELSPGEIGTLIDERVHDRDVVAEIINLAVQGFIKIERIEKKRLLRSSDDFILKLLRDVAGVENDFQRYVLNGIFGTDVAPATKDLSELKGKFSAVWSEAKNRLYGSLAAKGFFAGNPGLIRSLYFGGAAAGAFLAVFAGSWFGGSGVASIVLSSAFLGTFGAFMPKRTPKGVAAKERALGFKQYMEIAEKERLSFHNAPESDPAKFEKLLPFAIALGIEEQWAARFAHLAMAAPSWYAGTGLGGPFDAHAFGRDLGGFAKAAGSTLSFAPRGGSGFGGGGFSGGGFGGGGGSHW